MSSTTASLWRQGWGVRGAARIATHSAAPRGANKTAPRGRRRPPSRSIAVHAAALLLAALFATCRAQGAFRVEGSALGKLLDPRAGQPVAVSILGDGAAGVGSASLNITGEEDFSVPFERHDGVLEAKFHFETAGRYVVEVKVDGRALEELHVVHVVPGPPDVSTAAVVVVDHGEIGDTLRFKVRIRDAYGNDLVAPEVASEVNFYGSRVEGRFMSPRGTERTDAMSFGRGLTIEALSYDELFVGSFTPLMAGEWRVHLVINGQDQYRDTWPSMHLSPGKLDARGCSIQGLGDSFMRRVGHNYRIPIVPGDKFGNEVVPERPEMAFACSVTMQWEDDPTPPLQVGEEIGKRLMFHEMDNVWYLEFVPLLSGTLTADVRILGESISSPLLIGVYPGPASASTSSLTGECSQLNTAAVGINNTLVIQAMDMYGNPAWHGDDPFYSRIHMVSSEVVIPSRITSLGNGNYTLTYSVETPGKYELSVTLLEEHILNSPLVIDAVEFSKGTEIVPQNSIARLSLESEGRETQHEAGSPLPVYLLLRDEQCLPSYHSATNVTYVLELTASPGGELVRLPLREGKGEVDSDGSMRLEANVTQAGLFDATVGILSGDPLSIAYVLPQRGMSWPISLHVLPSVADPLESRIYLRQMPSDARAKAMNEYVRDNRTVYVVAGTTLSIAADMRDSYNNSLSSEQVEPLLEDVRVYADYGDDSVHSAIAKIEMSDSNIVGNITVTKAGQALLQAAVSGQLMAKPVVLSILPGMPTYGMASVTGNASMAVLLEPGTILFQLHDMYRNSARLPSGWRCKANATLSPIPDDVGASSTTVLDLPCSGNAAAGTLELQYNFPVVGVWGVSLTVEAPVNENESLDLERPDGVWTDSYLLSVDVVIASDYKPMEEPLTLGEDPVVAEVSFPWGVDTGDPVAELPNSTFLEKSAEVQLLPGNASDDAFDIVEGMDGSVVDTMEGGQHSSGESGVRGSGRTIVIGAVAAGGALAVVCLAMVAAILIRRRSSRNAKPSWEHMHGSRSGSSRSSGHDLESAQEQGNPYETYAYVGDSGVPLVRDSLVGVTATATIVRGSASKATIVASTIVDDSGRDDTDDDGDGRESRGGGFSASVASTHSWRQMGQRTPGEMELALKEAGYAQGKLEVEDPSELFGAGSDDRVVLESPKRARLERPQLQDARSGSGREEDEGDGEVLMLGALSGPSPPLSAGSRALHGVSAASLRVSSDSDAAFDHSVAADLHGSGIQRSQSMASSNPKAVLLDPLPARVFRSLAPSEDATIQTLIQSQRRPHPSRPLPSEDASHIPPRGLTPRTPPRLSALTSEIGGLDRLEVVAPAEQTGRLVSRATSAKSELGRLESGMTLNASSIYPSFLSSATRHSLPGTLDFDPDDFTDSDSDAGQ